MLPGSSWTTLQSFFPVQCYPKNNMTILNRTFSNAILRGGASWASCTRVLPVEYCLRSIRTTLNRIFSVQCCPKRIKTILNRMFPGTMLSGALRATLHRICTCASLSQEY